MGPGTGVWELVAESEWAEGLEDGAGFVAGGDDMDAEVAALGGNADDNMAIGAGKMAGEAVGGEEGFGGDAGGEDGAFAGIKVGAEEVGEDVDGGVGDVPGGDDPDARLKGADEGGAACVEVAVMIGDGDVDGTGCLGDGGFDVVPGEATVVCIAGEVTAGVVTECAVLEQDGCAAHVLSGHGGGVEGWDGRKVWLRVFGGAGPHIAIH